MILAIDIGNTNIVIGCFQEKQVLFRERLTTKLDATDLEYAVNVKTALEMNGLKREEVVGAIISSVVPSADADAAPSARTAIMRMIFFIRSSLLKCLLNTNIHKIVDS